MGRCDIEFLDEVETVDDAHVAKSFRINGEEIFLPSDARFSITAGPEQPTVVTVQLMATSVRIAGKSPAGSPPPGRWPGGKGKT